MGTPLPPSTMRAQPPSPPAPRRWRGSDDLERGLHARTALSPPQSAPSPPSLTCAWIATTVRPVEPFEPLVRPPDLSHPVNGGSGASNNGGGWADPSNPLHRRRHIQQRRLPESAALRRGHKCSQEPTNALSIQSAKKPSKLTQQHTSCPRSTPRRRSEPASGNAPLLTPCAVLLHM